MNYLYLFDSTTLLSALIIMIYIFVINYCIFIPFLDLVLATDLMQLSCVKGQGEDNSSTTESSEDPHISCSK